MSAPPRMIEARYRGIRYRADVGFELRCDDCARGHDGATVYWPITLEFWAPSRGMSRCRACWFTYDARMTRQRRLRDVEAERARDRAAYRANRAAILAKRRDYYQRNRERIVAGHRERYARRRAAELARRQGTAA